MSLARILRENRQSIALVIGNGVNRHGDSGSARSWDGLLESLARKYYPNSPLRPGGVTKTEFFDILDIASTSVDLQKSFCSSMAEWAPGEHHEFIASWARKYKVPILTTNFDELLSNACKAKQLRTVKGKFTAFYPWESYYGDEDIQDPRKAFGIWHINGMKRYRQSVRLGLTDYMGQVQRARTWLHQGKKRLFANENHESWRGSKTWLHMIFGSDLLFIGLALDQDEVFLRWLLLERAKYFRRFPGKRRQGWYVSTAKSKDEGKKFFLNGVGIEIVEVASYDEIYKKEVWSYA